MSKLALRPIPATISNLEFNNSMQIEECESYSNVIVLESQQQSKKTSSRFKTTMCKHMKRKGYCVYGSTCKFAHSKYELWFPYSELKHRKKCNLI